MEEGVALVLLKSSLALEAVLHSREASTQARMRNRRTKRRGMLLRTD